MTRILVNSRIRQLDLVRSWNALLLTCVMTVAAGAVEAPLAVNASAPKAVLLLLPFEGSRPATHEIMRGLEAGLKKGFPSRVTIFVEFIGPPPGAGGDYPEKLFRWIQQKYRGQTLDALCPILTEGLTMAQRLQKEVWPSIPIVYGTTKESYGPEFSASPRTTGLVQATGEEEVMRAALAMLPDTREVAIVNGASPADLANHRRLTALVRRIDPSLGVVSVSGLSLQEAVERVTHLPDHSIVYLNSFGYDRERRPVTLPQLLSLVGPRANRPMFTDAGLAFGLGVVGGPMFDVERTIESMGRIVARVLLGTRPEDIPVERFDSRSRVDWRELKRWGIPEERVPRGSEVAFRTLTVWEVHRGKIVAAGAAIFLQALLIGFLLVERHRREASETVARSSVELSRAILSSLSERIAVLDDQGTVIRLSEDRSGPDRPADAFPRMVKGDNYLEVWKQWADGLESRDRIAAAVAQVQGARENMTSADYHVRVGDQDRWVEVRVERLNRPEGGAVVTHLDITQRRQAELDRRRTLEELHHVNRVSMMGELAGSLAHELAQPLASILTNAQAAGRFAARANPDYDEVLEALTQIAEDDRRANAIIQRMRAILKKQPVAMQEIDLNRTVEEVVGLLRTVLLTRSIQVDLELAEGGAKVRGDAVALQQVLLNLINNGMDAVSEVRAGDGRLTVRTMVSDGTGRMVVEDNGPGIPSQIAYRLFDSFFTTKVEGMGMGLSICRSILESFDGTIYAENRPDGGAAFHVLVPQALPAANTLFRQAAS